ncbi:MAG: hypothetical protein INR64_11000 [Caulobacteraceae bacterium]|nr:hypothetical protein [Caulobacter sp.]
MTVWRWKAFAVATLCFALAVGAAGSAATDLTHLSRGFTEHRTFITSAQYAASAVIFTPFMASLGLIALFSKQATPEEMRSAATRRGPKYYFIFVFVSIAAALLAPLAQFAVVNDMARARGYVACPRPSRPRHQPDRWALPGLHGATERCPGEGADPNV